jgi:hypothetical protein
MHVAHTFECYWHHLSLNPELQRSNDASNCASFEQRITCASIVWEVLTRVTILLGLLVFHLNEPLTRKNTDGVLSQERFVYLAGLDETRSVWAHKEDALSHLLDLNVLAVRGLRLIQDV